MLISHKSEFENHFLPESVYNIQSSGKIKSKEESIELEVNVFDHLFIENLFQLNFNVEKIES